MLRIICILLSFSRAPLTNRTRKTSYRAMNGSLELLRAFRNMKRLLNPRLLCLDGHPSSFYSILFLLPKNRLKLSVCCLYGLTLFSHETPEKSSLPFPAGKQASSDHLGHGWVNVGLLENNTWYPNTRGDDTGRWYWDTVTWKCCFVAFSRISLLELWSMKFW